MSYRRLIVSELYQIYALVGKQCAVREIGAALGRDKGTVRRELRPKSGGQGVSTQTGASVG